MEENNHKVEWAIAITSIIWVLLCGLYIFSINNENDRQRLKLEHCINYLIDGGSEARSLFEQGNFEDGMMYVREIENSSINDCP